MEIVHFELTGEKGPQTLAHEAALAEAQAAEAAAIAEQEAAGGPIMRRLRGAPGVCARHEVPDRLLTFSEFCTFGLPDARCTSGVAYLEVEVVEPLDCPQLGFVALDWEVGVDEYWSDGVGDDSKSWAVDGQGSKLYHDGDRDWAGSWAKGDVIGLAASVEAGKVAVSKNGSWMDAGCGVVFEDEKIKAGVYPALTAVEGALRYRLVAPFRFEPPPREVWRRGEG